MNDAKACYNRIDHNFAILALMVFGVPWAIARNFFLVLQQAHHSIKTGYRVSKPVYGNEDANNPIAGIGQGNGIDPSLWVLISTIIVNCCRRKGHGTTIIAPISNKTIFILGFAFVDDTDLVTAANNAYQTGTEMIGKMQALMTDWCGCIRATGGFIAPTKTRWFLVSFFWNGNDWDYKTKDSLPGAIALPDKDGQPYTVNREEPTTAFESLGLQMDLANTSSKALDDVTDECQNFQPKSTTLSVTKLLV